MSENNDLLERLTRVETKLDIVIGQHGATIDELKTDLSTIKSEVRGLDRARWIAAGACVVALGSGAFSVASLIGV